MMMWPWGYGRDTGTEDRDVGANPIWTVIPNPFPTSHPPIHIKNPQ